MEGIGKFLGGLAAIAIGCAVVYNILSEILGSIGAGTVWLIIGAVSLIGILYWAYKSNQNAEAYEALPEDGPMRITLSVERVTKGIMQNKFYRLHIKAVMSQKDRRTLNTSGLELHSLFSYEDTSIGPDYPVTNHYRVANLLNTPHMDFKYMQDLESAKSQLMMNLPAIKNRLEQQRDIENFKPTSETFEI